MTGREVIGHVVSPTDINIFEFELHEGARVRKGEFVVVRHPVEKDCQYLCRVISGRTENPVFRPRGSSMAFIKAGMGRVGKEHESRILVAEIIGYITEDRRGRTRFMPPDFAPSPGDDVFRARKEDVEMFRKGTESFIVDIFEDPFSGLDIGLDYDWVTKGHVFVCGQTRSGKSTWILSFVRKALEDGEKQGYEPKFIIFDRYGEYVQPLKEVEDRYSIEVVDYRLLLQPEDLKPRTLAVMFGLNPRRKAGESLGRALACFLSEGQVPSEEEIVEEAMSLVARDRTRIEREIRKALHQHGDVLERLKEVISRERPGIEEILSEYSVFCIDMSTDIEFPLQQSLLDGFLQEEFAKATSTKGEISCVNIIEEAMFYAPESGAPVYGDPKTCASTLAGCLSQLGGYNVGFILCAQRPAYVSKNVIGQCNTIVCFRMRMRTDHEQIASIMGYPTRQIAELVSNLPDHRALLHGPASPLPFPVIVETKIVDYPRKAIRRPSEVLRLMATRRREVAREADRATEERPLVHEEPEATDLRPPRDWGNRLDFFHEAVP